MIIFPNGMAMPGARYGVYPDESGNSELGKWMSACPTKLKRRRVDPLAAKYPGCLPAEVPFYGTKEGSPYNYTLGNPVNLIDPNGMEVLEGGGEEDDEEEEVEYKKAKDELFARLWEHITHEAQNAFQNLSNTFTNITNFDNKSTEEDNPSSNKTGLVVGVLSGSRGVTTKLIENSGELVGAELKYLKFSKGLSNSLIGGAIGISTYQFIQSSKKGSDYARLGVTLGITVSAFIPYAGPFIATVLGIADYKGYFDPFYKSFNK